MQHLRCVSTLCCKTGKKKKHATRKEHVSPRWFMAWFTVPWIHQAEACCVFSRLWLRWVHFKLPNRRQCRSKLRQMESGRHSRDDSGSRWALPRSGFVLRGVREDTELTSSGRPPLLYMDGDGMNGDTKARTKRERKGVVRGEGWVECAELAQGGARDRRKKQRHTRGYAIWQVLTPDTGGGGIHKKLWGGEVVRGIDRKGNTNRMEPRWSVQGGMMI